MSAAAEKSNRLPVDANREQLMVKVARMAYHMDLTQLEIARETGLTRWQVSRLLKDAKDSGIVRIEIVPMNNRYLHLESALSKAFGLRDCVVVADAENSTDREEAVAKAAGEFLAALTPNPSSIGLSWGRTMSSLAHWLPQNWAEKIDVVGINGTVMLRTQADRLNDVVELVAQKGRGNAWPMPVPALVGEAVTREILERDRIVADVLDRARNAEVLCFSFGYTHEDSVLVTSGNVRRAEMKKLMSAGAVGDILGRFVDINCNIVDPEIDNRTIGLSLEDTRNANWAIGVCAGPEKHNIALAAVGAGVVNALVTDSTTAEFLLRNKE